ncbi:hypothetical protein CDAIGKPJ_01294 [Aeromonas salmonicida]
MLRETLLLALALPLMACTTQPPAASLKDQLQFRVAPSQLQQQLQRQLAPLANRLEAGSLHLTITGPQPGSQLRKHCASSWPSGWRWRPASPSSRRPGKRMRSSLTPPCNPTPAAMPEAYLWHLPALVWYCATSIAPRVMGSTGPAAPAMTAVAAPSMPVPCSASIRARPSRPRNSRRQGSSA